MNHADHVQLLKNGGIAAGQTWADLGAGTGAFTLALAELLGTSGTIYAVDRDRTALRQQEPELRARFPNITANYLTADFTTPLQLPPLDGIIMANSLHFVRDQAALVRRVRGYLRPGGRLLLVEYNAERGNQWVPYPLTFAAWATLAAQCGFTQTEKIGARPSRFLGEIYSASSI